MNAPEWTMPRELVALQHMCREMETLDRAERQRVLAYLNDRYESQPQPDASIRRVPR